MILSVLAVSLALFREPPRAYAPHVWWHWMNGNVTKEGITADLEAMAEIGLGAAHYRAYVESALDHPRHRGAVAQARRFRSSAVAF